MIPTPKNIKAKILYALITKDQGVSEREIGRTSFRHNLSLLRYNEFANAGVTLKYVWKSFTDEFKTKVRYKQHFILSADRGKVKKIYKQVNK